MPQRGGRTLLMTVLFAVLISVPVAAYAQQSGGPQTDLSVSSFLAWATGSHGIRWAEGAALAGLGFLGALASVYFVLGDFLPAMGGRSRISAMEAELSIAKDKLTRSIEKREGLIDSKEPGPELLLSLEKLTHDLAARVESLDERIASERRTLLRMGIPAYLLLGAFLASAVATNLLQAVLVGSAWTVIAERIGLTKDNTVRQQLKTEAVDQAESLARVNKQLQNRADALQDAVDALLK